MQLKGQNPFQGAGRVLMVNDLYRCFPVEFVNQFVALGTHCVFVPLLQARWRWPIG